MSYTSYEIQDISSEYRNIARRLSRTDYSQCDANLKRFMGVIQSNSLISDFLTEKNTTTYDIEKIIKSRGWLDPFVISADACEEISLEYQLLLYAIENFDGDFTLLYGGYNYTSAKSTINDEMQKFIEHIIDPFIDHISEHLRRCYEKAVREESKNMPIQTGGITANYSTVVVGSNVDGAISTHNVIDSETEKDAIELISVIKETLNNEALDDKNDILEILQQIEEDIHAKQAQERISFSLEITLFWKCGCCFVSCCVDKVIYYYIRKSRLLLQTALHSNPCF